MVPREPFAFGWWDDVAIIYDIDDMRALHGERLSRVASPLNILHECSICADLLLAYASTKNALISPHARHANARYRAVSLFDYFILPLIDARRRHGKRKRWYLRAFLHYDDDCPSSAIHSPSPLSSWVYMQLASLSRFIDCTLPLLHIFIYAIDASYFKESIDDIYEQLSLASFKMSYSNVIWYLPANFTR